MSSQTQEMTIDLLEALEQSQIAKTSLEKKLKDQSSKIQKAKQINKTLLKEIQQRQKIIKQCSKTINLLRKHLRFQNEQQQEYSTCNKGHLLRYVLSPTVQYKTVSSCHQCSIALGHRQQVCWICSSCNIVFCIQCKGFKKSVCPFSHPLKTFKKILISTIQCDICQTDQIKSGWHCDCDFDICDACYDKV